MEGHVHAGDLPAAQAVLDAAIKAGVRPTVVHYTILINGYARAEDPELATQTLQDMIAQGIRPDVPSVHALVGAYIAVRKFKIARAILIEFWHLVRPFPEDLRQSSLLDLTRAFCALHVSAQTSRRLTNQETRLLRWKLKRITHHKVWQERTSVRGGVDGLEFEERSVQNDGRGKEGMSSTVDSATKSNSH